MSPDTQAIIMVWGNALDNLYVLNYGIEKVRKFMRKLD